MKKKTIAIAALSLLSAMCSPAKQTIAGGIVYRYQHGFNMGGPKGWVLDNQSGASNGIPCVLYPKGSTWANAKVLMYAKVASAEFEDHEAFAAAAIADMKKRRGPSFNLKRLRSGQTEDGHIFFVNEYPSSAFYSRVERVAYIQLPKAVAYIVFSAPNAQSCKEHGSALDEALKSFHYLHIDHPPL